MQKCKTCDKKKEKNNILNQVGQISMITKLT